MMINTCKHYSNKTRKFNFFICKFASISYDKIILHSLGNKKIDIDEIEKIVIIKKIKKIIDYTIIKFLFISYIIIINLIHHHYYYLKLLALSLILFIICLAYGKKK